MDLICHGAHILCLLNCCVKNTWLCLVVSRIDRGYVKVIPEVYSYSYASARWLNSHLLMELQVYRLAFQIYIWFGFRWGWLIRVRYCFANKVVALVVILHSIYVNILSFWLLLIASNTAFTARFWLFLATRLPVVNVLGFAVQWWLPIFSIFLKNCARWRDTTFVVTFKFRYIVSWNKYLLLWLYIKCLNEGARASICRFGLVLNFRDCWSFSLLGSLPDMWYLLSTQIVLLWRKHAQGRVVYSQFEIHILWTVWLHPISQLLVSLVGRVFKFFVWIIFVLPHWCLRTWLFHISNFL